MKTETSSSLTGNFIRHPFLLILLLLILTIPLSPALSQESPQTTQLEDNAKIETPEQHIETISLRKKELEDERNKISGLVAKATEEESSVLRRQLELLDQTIAILGAQISEWKRHQELETKQTADREEIARLEQATKTDQPLSILDLDRAREELAVESARFKVVRTKVDLAKEALEKAQRALKNKQDQMGHLQGNGNGALKIAKLENEFAAQRHTLRELELKNEEMTFSAYETHLELLRKQIDFLQEHARFDDRALKVQLDSIKKHEFELSRDLARLKDQQLKAQDLFDRSRKRLEAASFEDEKAVEETEARRLELEALKSKIDATQREMALLTEQKAIWQKRHSFFNQSLEHHELPKWRSEANADIERIEQEQAALELWLSDWQSRLNAVNSKSAYSAPDVGTWYDRQSRQIQSIIDTLTNLNSALEKNRRVHRHLVDDINYRNSQHSLRDWIKVLINLEFNHNSLLDWACAVAIASISFMLLYVLRWFLIRALRHAAERKHFSQANELLNTVKRANLIFFLVISIFFASLSLTLDPATDSAIAKITKVVIALQVAVWLSGFLRAWVFRILARKTKRDGASMGALAILNFTSQIVLWSVAVLLILQNLGIDITALIAGLGIGGIAVALALQRILSDLFASLSIVLDKPFVIGDFVNFGDFFGTIEHIGVKTTRLRSLTGEQIICANGELLDTRIRNYKRMQERRVVFKLRVVYDTPYEKLQGIPAMLKAIIEKRDKTRFDRAHFFQYGHFSLDFEIVYYVLSPDYGVYMDAQQAINLDIYRRFQQEGIEFAYPTQSLYLHNRPVSRPKLSEIG